MPQANDTYTELYWLIGIVVVTILFILLVRILIFIDDFRMELKYINVEIERNSGEERNYWIHRKRRLWRSLIPFVKY